jgi:hypothetical protein
MPHVFERFLLVLAFAMFAGSNHCNPEEEAVHSVHSLL